jgi:iron(III) transport system permease protein
MKIAAEAWSARFNEKTSGIRRSSHLSVLGLFFIVLATVGILVLAPPVYLLIAALAPGTLESVSPRAVLLLAGKSLSLAALSTLWAMFLALPLAWLVIRTDLSFRNLYRWIAVLPLAIPSYIGALTYISLLGPVGIVNKWLSAATGMQAQWVNVYGFWGGVFILGLFTYPYIFLLACSALETTNPAIEETARSLGEGPAGVFRRVTLPMLRPAILAGSLLAFLYALSDFGSLSLLRVHVFTTEIYHQLNTRFDQAASSMLSFVLVLITFGVLIGQRFLLGRRSYVTVTGTARIAQPIRLGSWRWAGNLVAVAILGLSVFLPVTVLFAQAGSVAQIGEVFSDQWRFFKNSLWTAAFAACIAAVIGLLIAYADRRAKGAFRFSGIVQMGYAIPGTVLGLSLILLYNTYLPWLYGTIGVLILAYLTRFLTQSVQGLEAGLSGINPHLEEAGRSLAASHGAVLRRIVAPLLQPTLIAVWALVFISAMKELDATLLLRPPGFDTIPVRVYIHTVEAEYGKAAALSLLLIACTALPWLIVTRRKEKKIA